MAKSVNQQEHLAFALEILKRIPKNKKISTTELHQQLKDAGIERDIRSIQRQLNILSEHFEIERDDRSKPYGYRWKSDVKSFAIPNISEKEALLLVLAKQHLHSILPQHLLSGLDSFFEQAQTKLEAAGKDSTDSQWLGKVCISERALQLLPPEIETEVFETVSKALYNNHYLTLIYKNLKGYEKEYRVMPLGLAQVGTAQYLIVRFDGYDNERTLACHRIQKATLSTMTFKRPENFDITKYEQDGRLTFGEGKKVQLKFTITKEAGTHLLETPLSKDQIIEETDTHFHVSATLTDGLKLDRWLRGFGEDVSDIEKELIKD